MTELIRQGKMLSVCEDCGMLRKVKKEIVWRCRLSRVKRIYTPKGEGCNRWIPREEK